MKHGPGNTSNDIEEVLRYCDPDEVETITAELDGLYPDADPGQYGDRG